MAPSEPPDASGSPPAAGPSSEPAPAATQPDSDAPQSSPASSPQSGSGAQPAGEDVIQQALDAVKTAFPRDSSDLYDLLLASSDDGYVAVTIVMNGQPKYRTDQLQPIADAIGDQFQQLGIPQVLALMYQFSPDEAPDDGSSASESDSEPPSSAPSSGP
jgi:hypothetical protein